jgi:hypothetical protein
MDLPKRIQTTLKQGKDWPRKHEVSARLDGGIPVRQKLFRTARRVPRKRPVASKAQFYGHFSPVLLPISGPDRSGKVPTYPIARSRSMRRRIRLGHRTLQTRTSLASQNPLFPGDPYPPYAFINERGQPFGRMGIGRMMEQAGEAIPGSCQHAPAFDWLRTCGQGMDTRRLQHFLGQCLHHQYRALHRKCLLSRSRTFGAEFGGIGAEQCQLDSSNIHDV